MLAQYPVSSSCSTPISALHIMALIWRVMGRCTADTQFCVQTLRLDSRKAGRGTWLNQKCYDPLVTSERTIQNVPSFGDYYDMGKEVMPSTHRYMKARSPEPGNCIREDMVRRSQFAKDCRSRLSGELCSPKVGQTRGMEGWSQCPVHQTRDVKAI